MHELSIIHSILEAAETELQRHGQPGEIAEIELEIGELAGVEIATLEFLWPAAVEKTILEKASCQIVRVPGKACCSDCGAVFSIQQFYDPCPKCASHLIQIIQGEELRIKSLTVVEQSAHPFTQIHQNWN